jgi:hypothetical protein
MSLRRLFLQFVLGFSVKVVVGGLMNSFGGNGLFRGEILY